MAVPILPSTLTNGTTGDATEVMADLNAIVAQMNGNLDRNNLKDLEVITAKLAALAVTYPKLGADVQAILTGLGGNVPGGAIARGHLLIPGEETRSNAAYGLLGTADRIQNVVVPANAQVRLTYDALWKESANGAAFAAVFIGANQLKVRAMDKAAQVTQAARSFGTAVDTYRELTTFAGGLLAMNTIGVTHAAPLDTGVASAVTSIAHDSTGSPYFSHEVDGVRWAINQNPGDSGGLALVLGEPVVIKDLAAGTYDFSVQYKTSGGASVSAKNRKLLIEVISF